MFYIKSLFYDTSSPKRDFLSPNYCFYFILEILYNATIINNFKFKGKENLCVILIKTIRCHYMGN